MEQHNLASYSLKELCSRADVSERTVRYYITEGLLPPSQGSGLASSYGQYHLYILLAIRWMKNQYLPLAEIKQRLQNLTTAELKEIALQAALNQSPQASTRPPSESDNALDYLAQLRASHKFGGTEANQANQSNQIAPSYSVQPAPTNWPPITPPTPASTIEESESWQRVTLAPEIELHYRPQPGQPERQAKIKQLLEQARQLFQA